MPLLARHFFAGGGLGEEVGWRGFLQSVFERQRGVVGSSLAVGVIWGLWHVPAAHRGAHRRGGAARPLHAVRGLLADLRVVALLHAAINASENAMRAAVPSLADAPAVTFVYAAHVLFLAVGALFVKLGPAQAASRP